MKNVCNQLAVLVRYQSRSSTNTDLWVNYICMSDVNVYLVFQ
jgi:hypothetical protein